MHALKLHLFCTSAAEGLVNRLRPRFEAQGDEHLDARFGPIDGLRRQLLAGERCDVLVATPASIATLTEAGELLIDGQSSLGLLQLCIAAREGDPAPAIGSAAELRSALLGAGELHFADPVRDLGGSHFAVLLQMLHLAEELAPRCRPQPDGSAALRALAGSTAPRALGCALLSEIRQTDGVVEVGPLPPEFALTTSLAAAVTVRSDDPALADRFIALLCGAAGGEAREAAGFVPAQRLGEPLFHLAGAAR
ncbi:molybdate ABC transporter substrate-binding protein [Roseateles violae]|uniref:Substrate-binding domain-containing protein n=1 Tax=Roseateles violae TaxID=3058042 RepID=A0ABT8DSW3_9BURK|nr:substrate-binding domain-containing protein [Pelomonas sp. PFR6]MDN3921277.1 substrate-binding domain-containing protein [Pelomonas sp. PFR6]